VFALLDTLNKTIQADRAGKKTATAKADVERSDMLKFISLFNVTGARVAMLADETGLGQLRKMRQQSKTLPGVDSAQKQLIDTMFGQTNRTS
jgi:hypothetical protein